MKKYKIRENSLADKTVKAVNRVAAVTLGDVAKATAAVTVTTAMLAFIGMGSI